MQNHKTVNIDIKRITYHLLFWLCFLIVYSFINLVNRYSVAWDYFWLNLLDYSHSLPPLLISNYIIVYVLIPRFIIKKRNYIVFIILTICCISFTDISDILIRAYYYFPKYQPEYTQKYQSYSLSYDYFIINFYNKTSIIIIFFALKFFKDYIIGYYENERLKQKNDEQKILLLKRQMHPKLLFDVLKHIKHLNESHQEKTAAESIALISNILRYSLYKDQEFVLFTEELSIIYKFLKLQKHNDPSFAIELLVIKEVDHFIIQHSILFNLIVKVISLLTNKSSHKEIILTFDFSHDNLVLRICINYNDQLKTMLYDEISTLLDSYTPRSIYQLKSIPDKDNIILELLLKNQ